MILVQLFIEAYLSLRLDQVVEGIVDTFNSKFGTKQISNIILKSKSKFLNRLKSLLKSEVRNELAQKF